MNHVGIPRDWGFPSGLSAFPFHRIPRHGPSSQRPMDTAMSSSLPGARTKSSVQCRRGEVTLLGSIYPGPSGLDESAVMEHNVWSVVVRCKNKMSEGCFGSPRSYFFPGGESVILHLGDGASDEARREVCSHKPVGRGGGLPKSKPTPPASPRARGGKSCAKAPPGWYEAGCLRLIQQPPP